MTNTLKHLSLLTRMENSGLKPRLTGKFPEDALDQACGRVETFQLQARLRTGNDNVQGAVYGLRETRFNLSNT